MSAAPKAEPAPFDAMAEGVTAAEVRDRLHAISEAQSKARFEACAADTLARLQARYGADGMAGVAR